MGTTVANSSTGTTSWAGWLFRGIGLGIVGCTLIWAAVSHLTQTAREMSSTFQIQRWDLALGQLIFLMVGGVFTYIVLLALRGSRGRSGLLVGGSLPPLVLLLLFFDAYGPQILTSLSGSLAWAYTSTAQTAEAIAFGVMVTALVWQSVKGRGQSSDDT